MTSALFKKKFPLTSIPLFLGKKKKTEGKEKKRKEKTSIIPSFPNNIKGTSKTDVVSFYVLGWFSDSFLSLFTRAARLDSKAEK